MLIPFFGHTASTRVFVSTWATNSFRVSYQAFFLTLLPFGLEDNNVSA